MKSERCALKTQTLEISAQDTETVQGNISKSDVSHDSNNEAAGNWTLENYHKGTYGRGYSSNYNRFLGRRNNWKVSGYSCRSVSPKSTDQIFLNSKDHHMNNEGKKNSTQYDNEVDCLCSKSNETVNVGSASEDCVIGTPNKDAEVALNGVEGVKASESAVRRKHSSQSLQSTVNGGRKCNALMRPRMSLVQLLIEYDEARRQMEFSRNFYTCKICFQVTFHNKKSLEVFSVQSILYLREVAQNFLSVLMMLRALFSPLMCKTIIFL